MTLDKAKFAVISATLTKAEDYNATFTAYENYLNENKINDEGFWNIVKYHLTKDKQFLLNAKLILLGDINIDNFMEYNISVKQLDILIEELEFDLKNNMHRVSTQKEYDYYHNVINNIDAYTLKNFEGVYATYIYIRCYKICKLVWANHELLSQYSRMEHLYFLLNLNRFDFYGYKLNQDLINLADFGLRFDEGNSQTWKAALKKYKADQSVLSFLLSLHPAFSTKSMMLWLYYIDNTSSKYIMEKILGHELDVDESEDIYQYYNNSLLQEFAADLEIFKNDSTHLKENIELIREMISFNLNHYDLTYIVQYLELEASYLLAFDRLCASSDADSNYNNRLQKIELITNYLYK